ncbi:MAG: hypothetical protein GY950_27400 [bacterium]|nr:hypothetical protein [bacterium]
MSLNYRIKKSWFGFWQKYKLKTQFKIASRLLWIFLIIWLIGSVLTILSQWAFTDHYEGTPFQGKYLEYFWPVIIELVSGYDIQAQELALNPASNVISVFMLITGIIIFAIFTGQIVSMFIHVLQRYNHLPEKPDDFVFNRPVIICGINNKLPQVIRELRRSPLTVGREIVVIDSEADKLKIEDKEFYKDVWYVKGDQADRSVLAKALGEQEASAIILASEPKCKAQGKYSDSRAIETAMAIEGYRETTHTVLELMDDRNTPHLRHTRINEWISIFEYGIKLTSQAALQHGMGSVFHYLLGGKTVRNGAGKTSQIFFTQGLLPERFNGLTYKEVRDKTLSTSTIDITLIGFARYVGWGLGQKYNLEMGYSPFIKQLNPVNRTCRVCGADIGETDELGRIQKKCPGCFKTEKNRDKNAVNLWYFPIDTQLSRKDKLIYLSGKPVDFNNIF